MNYSNSQRAGVILYLTALLFGGYLFKVIVLSLAFGLFGTSDGVVLSFVDFIFSIDYWGNAALVPKIIIVGAPMLVGIVLSIIACFFVKDTVEA